MYQTKVITDERQVPAGYISMVEVREKHGESLAKKLSDAHKEGKVPAVKLMRTINDRSGAVWVDMRAWDEWQKAKPVSRLTSEFHGTRPKNESPWDELVCISFAVQATANNVARLVETLEAMQATQLQVLACMQRLEIAWAAGDKAS
jgi:hypothetical protein